MAQYDMKFDPEEKKRPRDRQALSDINTDISDKNTDRRTDGGIM